MQIVFSEVESRRFGIRVFRARMETLEVKALREAMLAHRVDLAICRLPAVRFRPGDLDRLGMPCLVADTLVHYHLDLEGYRPQPPRDPDLEFIEGRAGDAAELRGLVEGSFAGYPGHYAANPLLPSSLILAGYVEWALAYLESGERGRVAWLVRRGTRMVAFATFEVAAGRGRVVLNGTLPQERGRGVYRDLIRFALAQSQQRGAARFAISTQVHNRAVQRVWQTEGLTLGEVETTFHINGLLDAGEGESVDLVLDEVTGGRPGGDGALIDRLVMPRLAVLGPGVGAGISRSSHCGLAPLRGGRYRLSVGLPAISLAGAPTVVARMIDGEGRLCHLAYYHLALPGEG